MKKKIRNYSRADGKSRGWATNSETLKAKITWKHGARTHFLLFNVPKKKGIIFQLRFSTKMVIHV